LQKELADVPYAFGQYVIASVLGINSNTADPIRALSTGDNSKGGSLVPNPISDRFVDLQRAVTALIGAGSTTVITDSSSLQIPTVVSDPSVAVKAENDLFVAGEPTFGSLLAQPYLHMSEVTGSREWFEDAINAAAMIESVLVRASATKVDYFGLQGTGSAQPLGLLNKPNIPSDAVSGSLDWFDLADSATTIREANHEPTGVILSPKNHGLLMKSTTGDAINSAQNWLMSPPNLEGKSLFPTSNCPDDKIVIGDFTKLFFCLRQGALLESSNVAGEAFDRHQIKVKLTMRADWVLSDKTAFHVITGIS
jgi:HK97 family phage major capsid protein